MGVKKLIVANWKLNPNTQEGAKRLFESVKKSVSKIKNAEVIICPPFVYIPILARLSVRSLGVGGQNVFYKEKGAYTGEISPLMLKDLNVKYAIVGHSERRELGETDDMINKKVKATLDAGFKPIFCVGEKEGEDKNLILTKQIEEGLKGVSKISNLIIAYEPVWAIGNGKNCSVDEALRSVVLIRSIVSKLYNQDAAKKVKILYGGSVNSKNASSYLREESINGLLVGGASLDSDEFIKIVEEIKLI